MLPSASGSAARSRQKQHDNKSSRFMNKRDIILSPNPQGFAEAEPPAVWGIYAKNVEYN